MIMCYLGGIIGVKEKSVGKLDNSFNTEISLW